MRAVWFCLLPALCFAQNYRAERTADNGVAIVRLTDVSRGVEVSIVPSVGNRAYEMKVHGKNVLYFPQANAAEYQARPRLSGIRFSRRGRPAQRARLLGHGKHYTFNGELGNVRGEMPQHGLLLTSPYWQGDRTRRGRAVGTRHQQAGVLGSIPNSRRSGPSRMSMR